MPISPDNTSGDGVIYHPELGYPCDERSRVFGQWVERGNPISGDRPGQCNEIDKKCPKYSRSCGRPPDIRINGTQEARYTEKHGESLFWRLGLISVDIYVRKLSIREFDERFLRAGVHSPMLRIW